MTKAIKEGTPFSGILPKEKIKDVPLERLVITMSTSDFKKGKIKHHGRGYNQEFATFEDCGDFYIISGRYPSSTYFSGAYNMCHKIVSLLKVVRP